MTAFNNLLYRFKLKLFCIQLYRLQVSHFKMTLESKLELWKLSGNQTRSSSMKYDIISVMYYTDLKSLLETDAFIV